VNFVKKNFCQNFIFLLYFSLPHFFGRSMQTLIFCIDFLKHVAAVDIEKINMILF